MRALGLAIPLALALAACHEVRVRPAGAPPLPPAPVHGAAASAEDAPSPPPEPAAADTPAPAALAIALLPPPPERLAPPPAPPPLDDDPARLIGLDAGAIERLIGRPGFTRREPPAELWQYVVEGCVFDVVLYPRAGVTRAAYFEARDRAAAPADARACFRALLLRAGAAG